MKEIETINLDKYDDVGFKNYCGLIRNLTDM